MEHARALEDVSRRSAEHGVLVHYHEIGLKGRNRGFFERRLAQNVERALRGLDHGRVEILSGRLLVHFAEPATGGHLESIARTFGVAFIAPCLVVPTDVDAMIAATLELLRDRSFGKFAIAARRATKEFALTSRDINIKLGAAVQASMDVAVDLSSPDVTVHADVLGGRTFLYADRMPGPGGLPVGASGKVVALLSGGIDSPVATYRVMRRGSKAVLVHFHSAPFTDRSSVRKANEIARIVAERQGRTTLYVVPLGEAQQQIVVAAPPALRVVLYRRLMVRVAARIAAAEGAKALVTGDSLGQVASQTIENIACVDDASPMTVLRPLIGDDKQEIIEQAKTIGTYDISIQPFEDCCSLFVPRSPATRATTDECRAAEAELDVDALVEMCFSNAEVEHVTR
jgi:tRNA uracil 4-sulfurtransferase